MTRPLGRIEALRRALESGGTTATELVETVIERIEAPDGEGARAFLRVARDQALATAGAADRLRAAGVPRPPLDGLPFSVKDLFDVAGEPTAAGSRVLSGAAPAASDATAVARLRAAGAVLVGRTNMTEFAYSGIGMNPHHGTPLNPFDRATGRVPGGSSSGAAVSVADGMAAGALGTDTGGSCRIPAALCGVTGFKPTAGRVPQDGVIPLSRSHDAVGVLGASVRCVDLLDRIVAGDPPARLEEAPLADLRFLAPTNHLREGMDQPVSRAFDRALERLSGGGARIVERPLEPLGRIPTLLGKGGIVAAEAFAWHADLLRERGGEYDPRVRVRIEAGGTQSAEEYLRAVEGRREIAAAVAREVSWFDAVLAPTTPIVAPALEELREDEAYFRTNGLLLRNPSVANVLDRPSVSIPCHDPGSAPVGLMLIGHAGRDRRLLAVAAAVEIALAFAGSAPDPGAEPGA